MQICYRILVVLLEFFILNIIFLHNISYILFKSVIPYSKKIYPEGKWRLADYDILKCKRCSFPIRRTNILVENLNGFLINAVLCEANIDN